VARKKLRVAVRKHTENGGYLKAPVTVIMGEAEFSNSFRFCYLPELTIEKIKGGCGCGRGNSGSHQGTDDGETYTVHKFKT